MAASTPSLRLVSSSVSSNLRAFGPARAGSLLQARNACKSFSTTSTRAASSPIFDLNGLSASRESQYFSKEYSIPRTEYIPTLQLIRSGEVDPFAPAPGSSIRASGGGAAAAYYNTAKNIWSNEDTPSQAGSGVAAVGTAATKSSFAVPKIETYFTSSRDALRGEHTRAERFGIGLLFGSLTLGALMLWGPDAWVIHPDHIGAWIEDNVQADKIRARIEDGSIGKWLQFWEAKIRSTFAAVEGRSQKMGFDIDSRAEKFDGMVRPRMEALGSAIRGDRVAQ